MDAARTQRHSVVIGRLPSQTGTPARVPGHHPADPRPLRILIVDDDRTSRESCGKFLEGDGYNVSLSGGGEEALHLTERQSFEIILLDLQISGVWL
jgi:PleD family two-component response regulator